MLSRRSSSFGRLFLWIAQLAVWDSGCTDRAHPRNLVGRWIEVPTPARGAASAILFNADGTTEWLDPAFDGACTVRRMSGMRWRATSDHIFFSGVALTNCAAPVATTPTPLWGPHATGGETSSPYVIERDGRLLLEFPSLSGSLRMGQHFRRAP